jgi:hypothetical protein
MYQLHWHSETLRVTLVNVHAHAMPRGRRGDPPTRMGRPLARVAFALIALAFPLLATGQGRGLLSGVLARYLRQAVRGGVLVSGGGNRPGLPPAPVRPSQ